MALHMNRRAWLTKLCDRIDAEYIPTG